MQIEAKRLEERVQPLFDNGMKDIKFFVPNADACSLPELLAEASTIQQHLDEGRFRVVDAVDGDTPTTPFDAPFDHVG